MIITDTQLTSKILIKQNPDFFELALLAVSVVDHRRIGIMAPVLNVMADKSEAQDFENPWHAALWRAMCGYYSILYGQGAAPTAAGFNMQVFWQAINALARSGADIPMSQITDLWEYFGQQVIPLTHNAGPLIRIVDDGLIFWLRERRSRIVLERAATLMWSAEKLHETLLEESKFVQQLSKADERMFAFGHGIDNPIAKIPRVPISLTGVTQRLGGGFGRGEATLFFAPNGAGKTVASCQLASEFSLMGNKGCLITTEQRHMYLEARMISNHCRIGFDRIKDGISATTMAALTAEQRELYREFRDRMDGKMLIYEWPKRVDRSVQTGLEEDLSRAADKLGGLDWFILDWLGSALGAAATDPGALRMMIKHGADTTVRLASEDSFNCIGIVNAQSAPGTAINRVPLNQSHLGECKSASDNMTNLIGITLMTEPKDEPGVVIGAPTPHQYWCVSKTRMGDPGTVKVRRNFGYQRFDNV